MRYPKSKRLRFKRASETTYYINNKWEVDKSVRDYLIRLDGKTNPYDIDPELSREEIRDILRLYRNYGWLVDRKKKGTWKKVLIYVMVAVLLWNVMDKEKTEEEVTYNEFLLMDEIEVEDPEDVNLESCDLESSKCIIAQIVNPELTIEEKQKIGQQILYVESRFLGLSKAPKLIISNNHSTGFDHNSSVVYISDREDLENYESYITLIIHLAYHANQYQEVEALQIVKKENSDIAKAQILYNATRWEEELQRGQFKGCGKSTNGESWMEESAKQYAKSALKDYVEVINDFWDMKKC